MERTMFMKDKKLYRITEFSKLIGVSIRTLQRWDKSGKLIPIKSPSGHRYYSHKQYLDYINPDKSNLIDNRKTVIYTRVSTKNQKDDLKNQVEFIQNYINAKGIIADDIIQEFNSGLNYNRKLWNELIQDCLVNKVKTIVIAHKDRFVKFGFEFFERLLKRYDVEIIVLNNDKYKDKELDI